MRFILTTLLLLTVAGAEWPDYRGRGRLGVYSGPRLSADRMSARPQPVWRTEVGKGHASMAVARDRVYAVGRVNGAQTATAIDIDSGAIVWTDTWKSSYGGLRSFLSGVVGSGKGPRATPVWDEGRLYVLGPGGELRCLSADDGALLWRTNIVEDGDASRDAHGVAATPLVVGDTLVAFQGGSADHLVLAYDKVTGEHAWSSLKGNGSYASPTLATLHGIPQIIVVTSREVVGLAPRDGSPLWRAPWGASEAAAQPVVVDDHRLFVSDGDGGALVAVERSGNAFEARIAWRTRSMKNNISSSVSTSGYIYGLDGSILACIDVETGTRQWKQGRFGRGQLLLAGDELFVLSESGEAVLVEAKSSAYVERARFQATDEKTFAVPALSDGRLYVRAGEWLQAYDLSDETRAEIPVFRPFTERGCVHVNAPDRR